MLLPVRCVQYRKCSRSCCLQRGTSRCESPRIPANSLCLDPAHPYQDDLPKNNKHTERRNCIQFGREEALGGNDMAAEWPLYILQCMVLIGLAGVFVIK
jgi:hypothetical protein